MAFIATAWHWLVDLVRTSFTDLAIAAIVLFTGLVAARVLSLLADVGLRKLKIDQALREGFGVPFKASSVASQVLLWGIAGVTVLATLKILGINAIVVTALAIFAIVVIAFSIVLALRDLVPNFIAGAEMHRKGFFSEGDSVVIDGERARVLEAGMLETILEQSGMRIVIPNAMLLRREIVVEGAMSPLGRDRVAASQQAATDEAALEREASEQDLAADSVAKEREEAEDAGADPTAAKRFRARSRDSK